MPPTQPIMSSAASVEPDTAAHTDDAKCQSKRRKLVTGPHPGLMGSPWYMREKPFAFQVLPRDYVPFRGSSSMEMPPEPPPTNPGTSTSTTSARPVKPVALRPGNLRGSTPGQARSAFHRPLDNSIQDQGAPFSPSSGQPASSDGRMPLLPPARRQAPRSLAAPVRGPVSASLVQRLPPPPPPSPSAGRVAVTTPSSLPPHFGRVPVVPTPSAVHVPPPPGIASPFSPSPSVVFGSAFSRVPEAHATPTPQLGGYQLPVAHYLPLGQLPTPPPPPGTLELPPGQVVLCELEETKGPGWKKPRCPPSCRPDPKNPKPLPPAGPVSFLLPGMPAIPESPHVGPAPFPQPPLRGAAGPPVPFHAYNALYHPNGSCRFLRPFEKPAHPDLRCRWCFRDFPSKELRDQHLNTHQIGEKPFECALCGKHFSQKGNLKSHLHTHATTRNFYCEKCGQLFKHRSSLRRHTLKNRCQTEVAVPSS